jgi:Uma2 family endonuclease
MSQTTQLEAPLVPAKFTLAQYHQMIEAGLLDDAPVELLNGVIVEISPEGETHAYSSHEAAKYLMRILGELADVRQAKPITISASGSEPEPDIAVIQDLGQEYSQHHPYPENIFWVIEYSYSSLRKDLEPKAKVYAAAGISEYWVINLRTMELLVMRDPVKGEYQARQTFRQGYVSPLAFPNLDIEVIRLLG